MMSIPLLCTDRFTLLWLMGELRREMRTVCPNATVRIDYAPYPGIDAFVEVTVAGAVLPPPLARLMDARFQLAEAEGYTVAVLVRTPVAG